MDFEFHHVGVVTRGLNACVELYELLGYQASEVFRDPNQGADIVLLTRPSPSDDQAMIELVSPFRDDGPAMAWAQRIDAGPYHTCYQVPDLAAATEQLQRLEAPR